MWEDRKKIEKGERKRKKKKSSKNVLTKFREVLCWFTFYIYASFDKYNERVVKCANYELGTVLNVL